MEGGGREREEEEEFTTVLPGRASQRPLPLLLSRDSATTPSHPVLQDGHAAHAASSSAPGGRCSNVFVFAKCPLTDADVTGEPASVPVGKASKKKAQKRVRDGVSASLFTAALQKNCAANGIGIQWIDTRETGQLHANALAQACITDILNSEFDGNLLPFDVMMYDPHWLSRHLVLANSLVPPAATPAGAAGPEAARHRAVFCGSAAIGAGYVLELTRLFQATDPGPPRHPSDDAGLGGVATVTRSAADSPSGHAFSGVPETCEIAITADVPGHHASAGAQGKPKAHHRHGRAHSVLCIRGLTAVQNVSSFTDGRAYTVVGVCPSSSAMPKAAELPNQTSWSCEFRNLMILLSENGKGLVVDLIDPTTGLPASAILQPVSATVAVLRLMANDALGPLKDLVHVSAVADTADKLTCVCGKAVDPGRMSATSPPAHAQMSPIAALAPLPATLPGMTAVVAGDLSGVFAKEARSNAATGRPVMEIFASTLSERLSNNLLKVLNAKGTSKVRNEMDRKLHKLVKPLQKSQAAPQKGVSSVSDSAAPAEAPMALASAGKASAAQPSANSFRADLQHDLEALSKPMVKGKDLTLHVVVRAVQRIQDECARNEEEMCVRLGEVGALLRENLMSVDELTNPENQEPPAKLFLQAALRIHISSIEQGFLRGLQPETEASVIQRPHQYTSSLPTCADDVGTLLEHAHERSEETGARDEFLAETCHQLSSVISVILSGICEVLEVSIPDALAPFLHEEKDSADSDMATSEPNALQAPTRSPPEEPVQPKVPSSGTKAEKGVKKIANRQIKVMAFRKPRATKKRNAPKKHQLDSKRARNSKRSRHTASVVDETPLKEQKKKGRYVHSAQQQARYDQRKQEEAGVIDETPVKALRQMMSPVRQSPRLSRTFQ